MTGILFPSPHPSPLRGAFWLFGNWLLEFIWNLGFGYWNLIYSLIASILRRTHSRPFSTLIWNEPHWGQE